MPHPSSPVRACFRLGFKGEKPGGRKTKRKGDEEQKKDQGDDKVNFSKRDFVASTKIDLDIPTTPRKHGGEKYVSDSFLSLQDL